METIHFLNYDLLYGRELNHPNTCSLTILKSQSLLSLRDLSDGGFYIPVQKYGCITDSIILH